MLYNYYLTISIFFKSKNITTTLISSYTPISDFHLSFDISSNSLHAETLSEANKYLLTISPISFSVKYFLMKKSPSQ